MALSDRLEVQDRDEGFGDDKVLRSAIIILFEQSNFEGAETDYKASLDHVVR